MIRHILIILTMITLFGCGFKLANKQIDFKTNVIETSGNVFEIWNNVEDDKPIQVASICERHFISIGEAMSCALPVLTTFETPWEIINQYNAGYIFNFSKKEIQLNLDKFMTLSDEERYMMGINALNLIKENFESKKIFNLYEDLYTSLI